MLYIASSYSFASGVRRQLLGVSQTLQGRNACLVRICCSKGDPEIKEPCTTSLGLRSQQVRGSCEAWAGAANKSKNHLGSERAWNGELNMLKRIDAPRPFEGEGGRPSCPTDPHSASGMKGPREHPDPGGLNPNLHREKWQGKPGPSSWRQFACRSQLIMPPQVETPPVMPVWSEPLEWSVVLVPW